MTKDLWLNLPVKDIKRSREFFTALGFEFKPGHANTEHSAGFLCGKTMVMLFPHEQFEKYSQATTADINKSAEVLISFDAESREEVDQLASKAEKAGGKVFGKPTEVLGWMYGCGFCDLDGHRWNVLFMDLSKMQKV